MDFGSSGSGVVREAEPYQVNERGEEDQNGDRYVCNEGIGTYTYLLLILLL